MSLLVKLDENLSESHAGLVRAVGHTVDHVTDEGLSGATDGTVWVRVVAEGRFFITLDLDFADVRRFLPGSHPGLLLLRPNSGVAPGRLGRLMMVRPDAPQAAVTPASVAASARRALPVPETFAFAVGSAHVGLTARRSPSAKLLP